MNDEKKFSEGLAKVSSQLFRFALRLTCNHADAEDLYQDAVLKAYKNRHQYDELDKFKPWIMTIMHNTFVTQYKKKKRRKELLALADDSLCLLYRTSEENRADKQMYYNEVSNLIDDLGQVCGYPLRMYAKGYSYEEISDHFKIPIGTVKSRLNFARTKLQEKMAYLYNDNRLAVAP